MNFIFFYRTKYFFKKKDISDKSPHQINGSNLMPIFHPKFCNSFIAFNLLINFGVLCSCDFIEYSGFKLKAGIILCRRVNLFYTFYICTL